MLILITYDVATQDKEGKRRLRRIAKICQNHGQRVQYSVFECWVDPARWVDLRARLMKEIDESADSLRFYRLGRNWQPRVEHVGAKESYDPEDPFII